MAGKPDERIEETLRGLFFICSKFIQPFLEKYAILKEMEYKGGFIWESFVQ